MGLARRTPNPGSRSSRARPAPQAVRNPCGSRSLRRLESVRPWLSVLQEAESEGGGSLELALLDGGDVGGSGEGWAGCGSEGERGGEEGGAHVLLLLCLCFWRASESRGEREERAKGGQAEGGRRQKPDDGGPGGGGATPCSAPARCRADDPAQQQQLLSAPAAHAQVTLVRAYYKSQTEISSPGKEARARTFGGRTIARAQPSCGERAEVESLVAPVAAQAIGSKSRVQ